MNTYFPQGITGSQRTKAVERAQKIYQAACERRIKDRASAKKKSKKCRTGYKK